MPRKPSDASLGVKFYHDQIEDEAASISEGRPVFRDREMIEILIPSDPRNLTVRPVEDEDRERFPDEYERFARLGESVQEGTPLSEWSYLKATRVKELQKSRIDTVEQLAGVQESAIAKLGPNARDEVAAAKAFIEQSKDANAAVRLTLENDGLREDLKAKDDQIEALKAEIAKLQGAKK